MWPPVRRWIARPSAAERRDPVVDLVGRRRPTDRPSVPATSISHGRWPAFIRIDAVAQERQVGGGHDARRAGDGDDHVGRPRAPPRDPDDETVEHRLAARDRLGSTTETTAKKLRKYAATPRPHEP